MATGLNITIVPEKLSDYSVSSGKIPEFETNFAVLP